MELAFSHIAALYSLQKLAASNSKFFSSSLFKSTISSRRQDLNLWPARITIFVRNLTAKQPNVTKPCLEHSKR